MVVLINKENKLFVKDQQININELREIAKEFIANPENRTDLPEKFATSVNYFGIVDVTKHHIISLQNDRGTLYKTYLAVQNELTGAYNELRNELSISKFNVNYFDFEENDPRKNAIDEIYPLAISEADPRDISNY